jgi:hypothetical protein
MPVLALLLVVNAAANPYREARGFEGFARVTTVPAFAGIWVSPVKLEAIELLHRIAVPRELAGRRLLVAGPHPWLYFATQSIPTTPMVFMHFSGGKLQHDLLGERLFRNGEPEVILLTNRVPAQVQSKIVEWMQRGCESVHLRVPLEFFLRYQVMTRNELANELVLIRRTSSVAAND